MRTHLGIVMVSLFERKPWSYVLINGGYTPSRSQ
jgi:hypothetical protein